MKEKWCDCLRHVHFIFTKHQIKCPYSDREFTHTARQTTIFEKGFVADRVKTNNDHLATCIALSPLNFFFEKKYLKTENNEYKSTSKQQRTW